MSRFVWYDLMTGDTKTAGAFYEAVVGWGAADSGMPGPEYTIFSTGPTMVGGMMPIPTEGPAAGSPPCWTGYIRVSDVDVYATRVTEAGGSIHRPPEDIPGVGRFAVVTDPKGAAFILFTPNSDQQATTEKGPGHIGWVELHAADNEKDFDFYAKLLGWTKTGSHDMGPMGSYLLFGDGGEPFGGMVTKTADSPVPYWLYYFSVDGIDAAAVRVKNEGGKLWNEPMQVPGGTWVTMGEDPTGATFALMSNTK